jgi:hypothetical protein
MGSKKEKEEEEDNSLGSKGQGRQLGTASD